VLSLLGSERGNRGDPETWHDFVPVCGDAAIADVIASYDYDRLIIELRNGSAMLTCSQSCEATSRCNQSGPGVKPGPDDSR
jgi:hypothetical protein